MARAERRLPDLLKGGDSPHIKLFACGWIWGGRYDHAATKDRAKADAAAREIPKYLREALDASATPEDSLGFYQFIHHNQGYILIYMKWKDAETTAIMKNSKAASWLADTFSGAWAIETAWKMREKRIIVSGLAPASFEKVSHASKISSFGDSPSDDP